MFSSSSSRILLALCIIGVFFFNSCSIEEDPSLSNLDREIISLLDKASGGKGVSYFVLPESSDFSAIPQDINNPLNADKVALGKLLFHETGLALNPRLPEGLRTYSCASCHHVKAGFQACVPQGIAEGGIGFGINGEGRAKNSVYPDDKVDVQPVRSPSALNIAFQTNILWNGQFGANGVNIGTEANWTVGTPKEKNFLGFDGVETQAIAGQTVHHLTIDTSAMLANPVYNQLFNAAFANLPASQRISAVTAGLAIAAYERTLLANQSPFQRWLKGDYDALSTNQRLGAMYFFGQAKCVACHTGPALNDMAFYALGMNDLHNGSYGNQVINSNDTQPEHKGRGGFTGRTEDMYKFKVPQLYNLKSTPFYGHGSSFSKVIDVIKYKNNAVAQNSNVPSTQLATEFKPLQLSEQQIESITDFIENALYDPNLIRYVPDALPSELCFPNNDMPSRVDLGCN